MTAESEKQRQAGQGTKYLCFSLGREEFAIPLLVVKEVIAVPEITPVPFSPPYFLGIMNLRGQVISVLDLRLKLAIKPSQSSETAIIICDLGSMSLGVVVDSINRVEAPGADAISNTPEIQNNPNAESITGVFKSARSLVLLLDICKALSVEDLTALNRNTSTSPKVA
ncbi:chemotaxis protein CheW [Oligoflexus tunisiensis]|uniref:chemotaxis protein CheW n=1 Tax=Oligoflexus tunisiensis TaxID=708132 RepID=UPI000A763AEB|nr:chemotaxis protein CheW [Oligoflexus tunisiensis]